MPDVSAAAGPGMDTGRAKHPRSPEDIDGLVVLCGVHEHVYRLVQPEMGLGVVERRGGRTVEDAGVQAMAVKGRDDLFQTARRRPAAFGGLGGANSQFLELRFCDRHGSLFASRKGEGRQHQLIEFGHERLPGLGVQRLLEQWPERRIKPVARDPDKDLGRASRRDFIFDRERDRLPPPDVVQFERSRRRCARTPGRRESAGLEPRFDLPRRDPARTLRR